MLRCEDRFSGLIGQTRLISAKRETARALAAAAAKEREAQAPAWSCRTAPGHIDLHNFSARLCKEDELVAPCWADTFINVKKSCKGCKML